MTATHHQRWRAIVPVKGGTDSKTRLTDVAAENRRELAVAMALDVVTALIATPEIADVTVVTSDDGIAHAAAELGALVLPDPGTGLNGAIASAMPDGPWIAVLGDLPALSAPALSALFAQVTDEPCFVPDAAGTGSTMACAATTVPTHFGLNSAHAHTAAGFTALAEVDPRLRHDVDTLSELHASASLGLGPHTTALLSSSP